MKVISVRIPRKSPSTWQAIGSAAVIRTHGRSSSRIRCLPLISALRASIRRTTSRLDRKFMVVTAKTPSPPSKVVPGLVHTGRRLA